MESDGWQQFLELCLKGKDPKRLEVLFRLLFTAEERSSIAKRCLIIQALLEGKKPQREMAKDLELSIAKITRGSNALKEAPEDLIAFLKKVMG